ncbi:MAG: hypothetical protein DLM59_13240 [Pseudonocardiales bacterium]|nr:MAG: hypothetical protein DLM59_13240 [Pseudonocardiales bacterium]
MARTQRSDLTLRIALGTIGFLGIGYGVFRILGNQSVSQPLKLAPWLIGAIVLHDFVLTPIVLSIGLVLTRFVEPRARRYIQGGLVTGALVTAIAIPLIYRRGKNLPGKALLERNYAANLALIIAMIAAVTAAAYAVRVMRDRRDQRGIDTNVRPPTVQTSGTPYPNETT